MLVGTWAAAEWAIKFYKRHRFERVAPARKTPLLKMDWTVPDRQIETSVVLANPPLDCRQHGGELDGAPVSAFAAVAPPSTIPIDSPPARFVAAAPRISRKPRRS